MIPPFFLDIDPSTPTAKGFPAAIAWSLASKQYKSVLIKPLDTWLQEESTEVDIDLNLLLIQGQDIIDVVREMNEDLDGETVYVDLTRQTDIWLAKLFDAVGFEPSFEIEPFTDLFEAVSQSDIEQNINRLIGELDLPPYTCDSRVIALLHLAKEEDLFE
ncbi:hypothetical protein OLMES_3457 [Oleiphilus messinensis]|uniref:Uncharacterized protein n=1 Tax=Oleiphilus messinensis TaxID=141451 RepID=A0A1Y0IDN0_9GAMM|nr:hypothetical protein [Oleiphilus messinensis]ARU57493.1 hypothetical protein OLMES_3457 [Oleiphilus messinensis]